MAKTEYPQVAILFTSFNDSVHTRKFLKLCDDLTYPNFIVVQVDNSPVPCEKWQYKFKKYGYYSYLRHHVLLHADSNCWGTEAANVGIRYIQKHLNAKYVLTISNDTKFDRTFLSDMVKYAELHPHTLVGCKVYLSHNNKLWYAGGKKSLLRGLIHQKSLIDGKLAWLTGQGCLIPTEVYESIGLYDSKHFPQYASDSDFSLRASYAWYLLAIAPNIKLYANMDDETSSDIRMKKQVTISNFFSPLWTFSSSAHFKTIWYTLWRHWSKPLIPITLFGFYFEFFSKRLFHLIMRLDHGKYMPM